MNKHNADFLSIIAFIECLFGFILLSNEIINYVHLFSIKEINDQFGGVVEWFKYKESCNKNIFLYSLLIITGLSFWINRKLHWGLTQISLITFSFVIIMNLCFMSWFRLGMSICLGILFLIIFIYLETKICSSFFLQTMGISKIVKWLFFLCGGLSCVAWLLLLL